MDSIIKFLIGWLTTGKFCKYIPNGNGAVIGNCVNVTH